MLNLTLGEIIEKNIYQRKKGINFNFKDRIIDEKEKIVFEREYIKK